MEEHVFLKTVRFDTFRPQKTVNLWKKPLDLTLFVRTYFIYRNPYQNEPFQEQGFSPACTSFLTVIEAHS